MNITKRDGRLEPLNISKIDKAVEKCFYAVEKKEADKDTKQKILDFVINKINDTKSDSIDVEDIQNYIETALMSLNLYEHAKKYILYREERNKIRNFNSKLIQSYIDMTSKKSVDNDLKRENANINADCSMGLMLKFGSEASKEFSLNYLIKPEHAYAHKNGDLHIHDLDFYPITMNCMQIPLGKLLKNGFNTGHGNVREPQNILSACALACIILQANQNEMFGGQSFPMWEYDLAPYVGKSFLTHFTNLLDDFSINNKTNYNETYRDNNDLFYEKYEEFNGFVNEAAFLWLLDYFSINNEKEKIKLIYQSAINKTKKETKQAMQAVLHNLNTMQSRAGAQVPFSSLNYGTGTTWEQRLIIKSLLEETDDGLGHGETPIFPVQIFKLKDGINTKQGDPNYDLFKLACKVSAKRLFPNFSFIDSPFNLQYYKKGHPETEVAIMGCRTRVAGNTYDPSNEVFPGRGNVFFTTINLPRLGILANHDLNKFFNLFDERIHQCITIMEDRFKIISKKHVYNYPFLMGEGVYLGSDKLDWEDEIGDILKQGSFSVGFIGLAECLVALIGKHHGECQEARDLGIKIIKHLRDRMDNYSKQTGLNWSCFATPAEGLSGRFVKIDSKRFGVLKGITDREYYTNSFHIPVYYNISVCDKIKYEAPYHDLCNAGAISYVELDGDLTKNTKAFEDIVLYAKMNNLGYFSINHPVDRCPVCGYVGVINDMCPRCSFTEKDGAPIEKVKSLNIKCSC